MASEKQDPKNAPDALGYVLVGGVSSRFGRDKAFAELGGQPMYTRMLNLLAEAGVYRAHLIGDPEKYGSLGVTYIPDLWPGEGPLEGIITALAYNESACETEYNIIVGCDMPFLTKDWLTFLLERARKSDAEVVVPKSARGWEPLCACWRTDAVEMLLPLFKSGTRKITEALNVLHVEVLDEKDWKRFDTGGRLFWNMNTAADYEEARRVLAAENS